MSKRNIEEFIEIIENQLPDLVTPEQLLELNIAGSHAQLFRLRQKDAVPFLKLATGRILYLKRDIIEWLKQSYNTPEETSNESKRANQKRTRENLSGIC